MKETNNFIPECCDQDEDDGPPPEHSIGSKTKKRLGSLNLRWRLEDWERVPMILLSFGLESPCGKSILPDFVNLLIPLHHLDGLKLLLGLSRLDACLDRNMPFELPSRFLCVRVHHMNTSTVGFAVSIQTTPGAPLWERGSSKGAVGELEGSTVRNIVPQHFAEGAASGFNGFNFGLELWKRRSIFITGLAEHHLGHPDLGIKC